MEAAKRRFKKGEKGQAMVEFAFTVPIVIISLVAVVLLSWMLYSFVELQSATREGAHYAVTHPKRQGESTQDFHDRVIEEAKKHIGMLKSANITFKVEGTSEAGTSIDVSATYVLPLPQFYLPYLIAPGGYTFPPVQVYAVSTMYMD